MDPTDSMSLAKMQQVFEERKHLMSSSCSVGHCVTTGHMEMDVMFLTPENSPHSSSSSLSSSPYHSPLPPSSQYIDCAPLNLPPSPHHHSGSISPCHPPTAGSPYPPPMGSPPYCTHSPPPPYAVGCGSPDVFNASSPENNSPHPQALHYNHHYVPTSMEVPTSMDSLENLPVGSFTTSCSDMLPFDPSTHPPAVYSTPPLPMYISNAYAPHMLPPFNAIFDAQLEHPETYNSLESLQIKMVPNEYSASVIDYYPPTPPTPEGQMCSASEMCPVPPPLPPHLSNGFTPATGPYGRRKPKMQKPYVQIEVDDSEIRDIPTSAQLWEFTLRVLKKHKYSYMVSWENRKEGLFRFQNAPAFAALWGKHRNRPHMSYDKVARALRYYYKRNILEPVGGRLTYRFSKRLSKMYLSDV